MNKQPVHPTASQKGPDSINLGTGLAGGGRMLQENEQAALERLIAIAKRDTEQSHRVADFLLASWNSANCGGFDLTNLWAVDTAIAQDMTTVFSLIGRVSSYPDSLGYKVDFEEIVRAWRPELRNNIRCLFTGVECAPLEPACSYQKVLGSRSTR
jgi:hypothetical protein